MATPLGWSAAVGCTCDISSSSSTMTMHWRTFHARVSNIIIMSLMSSRILSFPRRWIMHWMVSCMDCIQWVGRRRLVAESARKFCQFRVRCRRDLTLFQLLLLLLTSGTCIQPTLNCSALTKSECQWYRCIILPSVSWQWLLINVQLGGVFQHDLR